MRSLARLGVAVGVSACASSLHLVGTVELEPSSPFTITSYKRVSFGESYDYGDIYVHASRTDSAYVGTIGGTFDTASVFRSLAVSADGRSIAFRYSKALYQYTVGAGRREVPPPPGYAWGDDGSGPRARPIPLHAIAIDGVDTVWALTATGEFLPLILLDASPLHQAAFGGRTDECAALVAAGATVDSLTRWGHTALDLAIISGHRITAIRLLDLGADPAAGLPALPLAVSLSRTALVDSMLSGRLSASGQPLLPLAVATLIRDARIRGLIGRVHVPRTLIAHDVTVPLVQLLLDRGADLNAHDSDGKTALDLVNAELAALPDTARRSFGASAKAAIIAGFRQPPVDLAAIDAKLRRRVEVGWDSSPDSGPGDRKAYAEERRRYLTRVQSVLMSRRPPA